MGGLCVHFTGYACRSNTLANSSKRCSANRTYYLQANQHWLNWMPDSADERLRASSYLNAISVHTHTLSLTNVHWEDIASSKFIQSITQIDCIENGDGNSQRQERKKEKKLTRKQNSHSITAHAWKRKKIHSLNLITHSRIDKTWIYVAPYSTLSYFFSFLYIY